MQKLLSDDSLCCPLLTIFFFNIMRCLVCCVAQNVLISYLLASITVFSSPFKKGAIEVPILLSPSPGSSTMMYFSFIRDPAYTYCYDCSLSINIDKILTVLF